MSDDLPISDVADQLHDDLLVKRLTDSDNTGFSNDLEKERAWTRYRKPPLGGFSTASLGVWHRARYNGLVE
jgi:hypothetical protein